MTNIEPDVHPAGRYNTTETARLLGVDRSTVRRNAQEGRLKAGGVRKNGHVFYTGMEILKFWRAK